jgi:hypothetical protein
MVALIKEKPSTESIFKRRPSYIVSEVSKKLGKPFTINHHTNAWKIYKVRPSSKSSKATCDKRFCGWLEGHEGYLYTDAWIDFLVKELADEEKYSSVIRYKEKS